MIINKLTELIKAVRMIKIMCFLLQEEIVRCTKICNNFYPVVSCFPVHRQMPHQYVVPIIGGSMQGSYYAAELHIWYVVDSCGILYNQFFFFFLKGSTCHESF